MPSPTPSMHSPSPSPTEEHSHKTTMKPPPVPGKCPSPPNAHSGCPHLGGGTTGFTLGQCFSKMNDLDGDTFNFKDGECYVKKCGNPDLRYQTTGYFEVYSIFCGVQNPPPPPALDNTGPGHQSYVTKDIVDKHKKPEQALGMRHQPWFPSWLPNMLWLSIPCAIGMVVTYRKSFRSCKHEGMRDTKFAFNSNEDDIIATLPLRMSHHTVDVRDAELEDSALLLPME